MAIHLKGRDGVFAVVLVLVSLCFGGYGGLLTQLVNYLVGLLSFVLTCFVLRPNLTMQRWLAQNSLCTAR